MHGVSGDALSASASVACAVLWSGVAGAVCVVVA